jgi:hypothetical protein
MSSSFRFQKSMKISYGSFHFSFCASPLPTTKPISNCSRHLREKTHGEGLRVSVRRPRPLALKLARFCGLTEFIAESGSFMRKCLNLADISSENRFLLCISPSSLSPFSVHVSMECR